MKQALQRIFTESAAKDAGPNSMKLKTLGGRKTRKRRKFVKGVS